MALQPDRSLQIQMVGGFVKQEHVRGLEQGGSQSQAHPPSAGKFPYLAGQIFRRKPQSVKNDRSPRLGGSSANHIQAFMNFGQFKLRSIFQPRHQLRPFFVLSKNELQDAHFQTLQFLLYKNDLVAGRKENVSAFGFQPALQNPEQSGLAAAVGSDQTDFPSRRQYAPRHGRAKLWNRCVRLCH